MAAKCKSGQVYSQKLKKCIPAPKSATSGLKDKPGGIGEFDKPGSMYRAEQRRSMRKSLGGASRATRKWIKES